MIGTRLGQVDTANHAAHRCRCSSQGRGFGEAVAPQLQAGQRRGKGFCGVGSQLATLPVDRREQLEHEAQVGPLEDARETDVRPRLAHGRPGPH